MPWFWGKNNDDDDEEEEYSDEYTDDDEDDEEYESEDESLTDEEENKQGEKINEEKKEKDREDASSTDAIAHEDSTDQKVAPAPAPALTRKEKATEAAKPTKGAAAAKGITPASYDQEFDDDEEEEEEENLAVNDNEELERIEAGVPDQVVGNRNRAPSALTLGETDDEEESNASADILDESNHSEAEQDHVTTLAEKQSLLVLAAEHDRVDILNSVLNEADEDTKNELLHGGIPPLHIAILNGSTNTATCLLRLGADPSVRPNVKEIAQNQDPQAPLDVPKQIDGLTAWELAFHKNIVPKAKQQGLMNAFSAEALRCMGSDEGSRLQQLLDAGMPFDMSVMGDKSLYDWAVELGAPQCEEALRPAQAAKHNANGHQQAEAAPASGGKSAVLDRPGSEETADQMIRQLEELESLAKALSTCLDSLAEEVSVSHGLLLMGGGASALASHVRSLKTLKEQKLEELSRHQDAFENAQDELDYWVNQAGPKGQAIAAEEAPAIVHTGTRKHSPPPKFASAEEEEAYCEHLHERIVATNDKIRKFRVSIADLSEENDRNMQEVEKRGLTGGINLVRGLKDEIREIEFSLDEIVLADRVYRAKIEKIQTLLNNGGANGTTGEETSVAGTSKASTEHHFNHANGNGESTRAVPVQLESDSFSDVASEQSGDGMSPSEKIATGHSTALVVRSSGPGPGSFPLSLWQILLRIIGLRDSAPPPPQRRQSSNNQSSTPAMIV